MAVYVIEDYNHFAQYAADMAPVARRIVMATIHRIEASAKASLSGAKHGRTYSRGRLGKRMNAGYRAAGLASYRTQKGTEMAIIGYRLHRASAPGEAPATDTGNLANSIGARMTGRTEGEVTVGAEYAAVLELGGRRTAPRPFFAPAVNAEWPEFLNAMRVLGE